MKLLHICMFSICQCLMQYVSLLWTILNMAHMVPGMLIRSVWIKIQSKLTHCCGSLTSIGNYPARYIYMYCTPSNLVRRQKCDSKKYFSYRKECMLLKIERKRQRVDEYLALLCSFIMIQCCNVSCYWLRSLISFYEQLAEAEIWRW